MGEGNQGGGYQAGLGRFVTGERMASIRFRDLRQENDVSGDSAI
jgi:hypothetical protein